MLRRIHRAGAVPAYAIGEKRLAIYLSKTAQTGIAAVDNIDLSTEMRYS